MLGSYVLKISLLNVLLISVKILLNFVTPASFPRYTTIGNHVTTEVCGALRIMFRYIFELS